MFERIKITEIIYEGVVTPSYKKTTRAEANHTGISRNKRGEASLSNTHPVKDEISGKRRKKYVDFPKSASKTCMIPLEPSTLQPSLRRTKGAISYLKIYSIKIK